MREIKRRYVILGIFLLPLIVWAEPVVVQVTEDTWVILGSPANHGPDDLISICPAAGYWIYLKFDLSGVQGEIESAELRMTRRAGSRPEEISVYLVSDDSWNENTLTGESLPAPANPSPMDALAVGEAASGFDRWSSELLTNIIRQERNGDAVISILVREDPGPLIDVRNYWSQEGAADSSQIPQLVITLSTIPSETLADDWEVADVGVGTKPAFDFDSDNRIHVLYCTQQQEIILQSGNVLNISLLLALRPAH